MLAQSTQQFVRCTVARGSGTGVIARASCRPMRRALRPRAYMIEAGSVGGIWRRVDEAWKTFSERRYTDFVTILRVEIFLFCQRKFSENGFK